MPPQAFRSKRQKQDDSIMATNNSSIVSKRSVERLYYPEPHFFQYFVKKPQRRSPLINRGYWLRVHAIDTVVRKFLDEPSEKRKIIMNLGCGYDPLAFQWLSKKTSRIHNVMFVDVDYPELMKKKRDAIISSPQLQEILQPLTVSIAGPILLRSTNYTALGCDLADTKELGTVLDDVFDTSKCSILCTAEVSITYMGVEAADSLIAWAAHYDDIRFCLLEQYLPDGADHPFAQKMIHHFSNLQTPLRSIYKYPALVNQERRFLQAGWHSVKARDLWNLWGDYSFLSSEQRLALNDVELFDEWEEFALFAAHYFLLVAIKRPNGATESSQEYISKPTPNTGPCFPTLTEQFIEPTVRLKLSEELLAKAQEQRRFGAAYQISPGVFGHYGGLGTQRRLDSSDVYKLGSAMYEGKPLALLSVEARMCHTVTNLRGNDSLLVGGRKSPENALADCWLQHAGAWTRVGDLPVPLYRHCAALIELDDGEQGVLVFGGKSNSGRVSGEWLLWRSRDEWEVLEVRGIKIQGRFGAVMCAVGAQQGILLGGMVEDGIICDELVEWKVFNADTKLYVEVKNHKQANIYPRGVSGAIHRIGASLVMSSAGLLLIGGLSRYFLPHKFDIIRLFPDSKDLNVMSLKTSTVEYQSGGPRPLLIGHSAYAYQDSVALAGGGAVCFSFGTYWNLSIYTLQTSDDSPGVVWNLDQSRISNADTQTLKGSEYGPTNSIMPRTDTAMSATPRISLEDPRDFKRIVEISNPVVMEDMDLGPCVSEWSLEALKFKVGAHREVVVHEASDQHMSFQKKNFKYVRKPFGDFLDQIAAGSKQYLRSLSSEKPSQQPAQLALDFPELASDFSIPHPLEMVARNAHSSPLRISGPVIMWLHYDVMANVLCQVRGSKRVLLYPPSDVLRLNIPPGASSSNINVFDLDSAKHPSLELGHPQEAILQPGDVLFIPPLWLHTACPTEGTSVSVNIFFRNLKTGYAAGRDVYGNRDLQPYEKGRKDIEKIARSFHGLPSQMSKFYIERLADELKQLSP